VDIGRRLARRYHRPGDDRAEELAAVAALGVAQAIERFDLGQRTTFAAFAIPTILGSLRRHLRDTSWALRVSRPLQERVQALNKAVPALSQRLERSPTTAELAAELDCTAEEVLAAFDVTRACAVQSLNATVDVDGEGRTLGEITGAADPEFERVEDDDSLASASARLTVRQRRAIELYFEHDLSQQEVAARLGVSQMQISRDLRSALGLLREAYERPTGRADGDRPVSAPARVIEPVMG